MGTNFYFTDDWIRSTYPEDEAEEILGEWNDPRVHIGKRSAAGVYCWDCDLTFCLDGPSGIHRGLSRWSETCPGCGAARPEFKLTLGAGAVELGFAQPNTERPTGVGTASSFGWAMLPAIVRDICLANLDLPFIHDEYDRIYTGQEFLTMLDTNCPFEFTHSIGVNFS